MDSEILVHKEFRTWVIRGWFFIQRYPDRKYKFKYFNYRSKCSLRLFGIYGYMLRSGRYEVGISTVPAIERWTREEPEDDLDWEA